MGFVISLLREEPQTWAHHLLEQTSPVLTSISSFYVAMAQIYDDPQRTTTAEAILHMLQQGLQPMEDYVVKFCNWSSDAAWNDAALQYQFRLGLSETLKD